MPSVPLIAPSPRDFSHVNISNPSKSWGGKFETHCVAGLSSARQDCLVGDSSIERLSTRDDLLPLFHEHFPNYLNLGIGGDRAQHVQWRIENGGFPDYAGRVVYSCGSNNIKSSNYKETAKIANTILATIMNMQSAHPSSELFVIGILPRENNAKCRAADTINDILMFKLPASVKFVRSPEVFLNSKGLPHELYFESDNVHLNRGGYEVLLNSIRSQMSLFDEASPAKVPPGNPVHDAYGIGELEYIGGGWDGEVVSQSDQDPEGYRVLLNSPGPLRPPPVIAEEFPPLPTPLPTPTLPRLVFYAKSHKNSTAIHRPHVPTPRQAPP